VEQRCRRIGAGEGAIIAHVDPQPCSISLALGQDRHGRIVAVQTLGSQRMRFDQPVERHQRKGSCPDLIGKRRGAQRHPFAGKPLGLTVEGLVLPVLLEKQHREEAGASPPARHDVERRRGLGDLLAVPARELLAHCLDDLPRPRDHLERLGYILAQLGQAAATAGRARAWRRDDDTFAGQMIGEWLACRLPALERGDTRRLRRSRFGCQIVFGSVSFEVFELQLHLLEQAARPFGAGAKLLAPELGDLQLEVGDDRFGGTLAGMGVGELRLRFVRPRVAAESSALSASTSSGKGETAASMD